MPSAVLNVAVVVPIPNASVRIEIAANPGDLRSPRAPLAEIAP